MDFFRFDLFIKVCLLILMMSRGCAKIWFTCTESWGFLLINIVHNIVAMPVFLFYSRSVLPIVHPISYWSFDDSFILVSGCFAHHTFIWSIYERFPHKRKTWQMGVSFKDALVKCCFCNDVWSTDHTEATFKERAAFCGSMGQNLDRLCGFLLKWLGFACKHSSISIKLPT